MRKIPSGFVRKIAATLLCLCLFLGSVPLAQATVVSAPLYSGGTQNGMVRVYLSSLGSPTTLNLTIAGKYSVNGNTSQTISSGESATVGFSTSTGAITLTRNGVKSNMGTYFALKRHSTTGTNGIKIAQGRQPGNPYPGDLSFQAIKQSNGTYKLYTIAHIYIENYLYGVLPYEMGNSAHIEALKAQAVAARTYTVSMMKSRSGGTYDVVDTTNDQVYNGTPTGNANCVAAVDATKGIVVMNGSGYTSTYYSASNGGQIESIKNAWGSSGYDYLGVKDDPFDLANPDSVVKKTTLSANCVGSSNNASLMSLLKTKAITALKSQGYSGATTSNTTLQTIKSITPHTPKYATPSKLYTKMDFTLTASTSGGTATVTVTCDIFSELESMLSMSIQSSTNELWSVSKTSSGFTLEARRYGHGIGMSQRGAMYMGKLGYAYDQVLGFYYPGCKRVRISFTNTILSANSSETITTVEDPADFDDDDAACTAVVKLVGSSSSLAIRGEKSLSGKILGVIAHNSPVSVYANDGTWCLIRFGNLTGYVPTNALSLSGTAPTSSDASVTQISGFATVQANGYLNLRSSGSTSASIVTTAPTGAILTVFSKSGGWAHIQFGATVAYASTDFLVFSDSYPGSVASSGNVTATVTLESGTGTVNLRATPSTIGSVLAQVPHGATVTVTRDDGAWATVTYNGQTGYIISSCLLYEGDSVDGGGTGDTDSGSTETGEATATVSTATGILRERMDESSPSILLIGMGQSVIVTDKGDPWCAIRYEGQTGYMLTSQLSFTDSGATGVSAIVATQSGSLNLRKEASAGSTILTTIPKGATVLVTSRGATWSAVRYNGISGYVMTSFLQFTDSGSGEGTPPTEGDTTAMVTTQSGSLNLRAEARAGSTILRTIPQYANITVHERGAEWCRVTYAGTTGYVMTVFLTFADEGTPTPTPEPTPEPTPDPGDDEGGDTGTDDPILPEDPDADTALYAVVTTASGSLNLRMDPLPGSPVLTRIPKGTTIKIAEKMSAWSRTTYAGQTGYVMNSYLSFTQGAPTADSSLTAKVTTVSGTLNLRAEPSTGGGVLLRIPQYATVNVQQKGATWCSVSYGGRFGYVMTQYLTFTGENSTDGGDSTGSGESSKAWVNTVSGSLNLRYAGISGSQVLTTIPNGAEVAVLSYGDIWCQLRYADITGYAMTQYLRFDTTSALAKAEATATAEDAAPTPQPETGDTYTAWVYTASGSLNLRETASSTGDVLTTIPRLASVTVLKESGTWCQVRYGSLTGYVMTSFLTTTDPTVSTGSSGGGTSGSGDASSGSGASGGTDSGTSSSGSSTQGTDTSSGLILDATLKAVEQKTLAVVSPAQTQAVLSLWPECSERGVPLCLIPRDATVEILQRGDTWCQAKYEELTGYLLTEYLVVEAE